MAQLPNLREKFMNNYQKHFKAALITALGYGLGFVIGIVVIGLVFRSGLLDSVADLFEHQHLTVGIMVITSYSW